MEREITSTEPLNMIDNGSDARSCKSNQHYTGDKSSNLNDTVMSQNKGGTNLKQTLIVGDSIVKNIEGWRLNKRIKFSVGLTVLNDRWNGKGKNVNSLLKRRCDEEKICFVDNTKINVCILNDSGLHLNERETTRLVIM